MARWFEGLEGGNLQVYGKVKWFDGKKGYGFIENEDGSGDVFVHYADIVGEGYRTLREGERVRFEISKTAKGSKAVKVERVPVE
jgi:CspA family cold shock protein